LDDPRFTPVFETAVALDVPIYLHPAPPPEPVRKAYTGDLKPPFNFLLSTAAWGWHVETGLHALRLMISGLFDRLPDLKIILGHMGENLPYSIVRANTVLCRAGLKLERSPLEIFQQNFWITTSGYFSIPPVLCAREVIGSDRILLSVDYPFSELKCGPQMLEDLRGDFTTAEIEGIAHGNAEKLLRI
jgi:predicted TIM-barrel fold metal-dependent hydrolase